MNSHPLRMRTILGGAAAVLTAAVLCGCGSSTSVTDISPTTPPPAPTPTPTPDPGSIPPSAGSSTTGFVTYLRDLPANDADEPLGTDAVVPPASDSDDPVAF